MKTLTRVLTLLAAGVFFLATPSVRAQNSGKTPSEMRAGWFKQIYGNREWKQDETPVVLILHDEELFREFSATVSKFTYRGVAVGAKTKVYNDPSILERVSPDIVFFGENATREELALLARLQPQGVVTVGEQPDFIKRGGIFQLDVDAVGKNRIKLNTTGLAASKVSFRSRFLSQVPRFRP